MLEFLGQVLEICMPVGRGTKGALGHLWVQAWTDNDYVNLRTLLRALSDIISSSGPSLEELFRMVWDLTGVRLSVQLSACKHFLLSHLLQVHWSDFV